MSQFLANLLSRHAGERNIIRPRSPGMFETHQSSLGPRTIETETRTADANTDHNLTYDNVKSPESIEAINTTPKFETRPFDPNTEPNHPRAEARKNLSNQGSAIKPNKVTTLGHGRGENEFGKDNNNQFKDISRALGKEGFAQNLQSKTSHRKIKDAEIREGTIATKPEDHTSDRQQNSASDPYKTRRTSITNPRQSNQLNFPPNFDRNKADQKQIISSGLHQDAASIKGARFISTVGKSKDGQSSTLKIHIGRIDIKAVKQDAVKSEPVQKPKPGISLEQFLNKRQG